MKGIIWKYLYTIALIAPLLAVVVVNNQWAYGAIYYRYGWFYLTVFVILLFTVLDFLFRKGEVKLFRVSVLDIILFFFISYLAVNYYLSTSISETYLCVDDSLPPRYKMVSQLPGIVSQLSLYNSLICAIF